MTEETNGLKRSPGRPPISPGERTAPLPAVKVGASTRQKIDFYADAAGLSLSEYIRQAINEKLAREGALLLSEVEPYFYRGAIVLPIVEDADGGDDEA